MPKHISSKPKALFQDEHKQDTKLTHFLQAVPFLDFTDTGLANVAKRFGITVDELKLQIAAFEARKGAAS